MRKSKEMIATNSLLTPNYFENTIDVSKNTLNETTESYKNNLGENILASLTHLKHSMADLYV